MPVSHVPTDVVIVLPFVVLKPVPIKAGTIVPAGAGALTFTRTAITIADSHHYMHVQPGRKAYSNGDAPNYCQLHFSTS